MTIAGTVTAIKAGGALAIRRDDGTTITVRPQFGGTFRAGDRVKAYRGRVWKIATAPALETKGL